MTIDREKEIKLIMFEKSELIRITKKELRNLRKELNQINKQKTLRRKYEN